MTEELFWADQIANKIILRENELKRTNVYKTEMGMGASGVPHVGSAGDGVRSFVVSLALAEKNVETEFIAFSDDRDGLRKIPVGFPNKLESEIGKPVSLIEDPFGCHDSYASHITSLLADAFEKLGVVFDIKRSHKEYEKGTFDNEIIEILTKHNEAGQIIKKITGQDKYTKQLPFMPICSRCGRIYTTRAYKFDGKKIHYKCDISFTGKNTETGKIIDIEGCGFDGTCGIRDGKLAWKVEFAARWRALKINYEAYGKDILESVKCNDEICNEILNYPAPLHSFYEMFVERSGKKISKSAGNVFTPQLWLKYGSPQSLRLLFLKKLATTRAVDADAIPVLMDEVDELADVYFGKKAITNKTDKSHMKRLYEYIHFLEKPKKYSTTVHYMLLANLLRIAKNEHVVTDILKRTGHIKNEDDIKEKLKYVKNWVADAQEERIDYTISEKQEKALRTLAQDLRKSAWTEESLKAHLFEIARSQELSMNEFFEAAYFVILNSTRGPRLAQLIVCLGAKEVANVIDKHFS